MITTTDTFYQLYYLARDANRGWEFTAMLFKELGLTESQVLVAGKKVLREMKVDRGAGCGEKE